MEFPRALDVAVSHVIKDKSSGVENVSFATMRNCRGLSDQLRSLIILPTGRRLGDRFREHLRDAEKDDKNAAKPAARQFNLPNYSKQHMTVCGPSLHQGSTESRKTLEQKFIFQIGTLTPHGINERFSLN